MKEAALAGYLFGLDPLKIHASSLADQLLYSAHLVAIVRTLAELRKNQ